MYGKERAELKNRVLKFLIDNNGGWMTDGIYKKLDKPLPTPAHFLDLVEEMYSEAPGKFDFDRIDYPMVIISANHLTEEFYNDGGYVALYKNQEKAQEESQLKKQEEDSAKIVERNKNKNQARLANWQVYTFWPLLFFGLIGGVSSLIQFFIPNDVEINKRVEILEKKLDSLSNNDRSIIPTTKSDSIP